MVQRGSCRGSLLPFACGVLLACGGQSENVGPAEIGESDGPGAPAATSEVPVAGAGADAFRQCPTPLGTAEELARTPREDAGLELLALLLDAGQVTATQATYERVVADVGAIRASASSLAALEFWGPHDGRTLRISFGERATEGLSAGTYTAWDCLLEAYRAEVGPVIDLFGGYAPTLSLGGIFDLPRVAEVFGQLPDASAEISLAPEQRTLCAARNGERYEYVVDRTNGSCRTSCQGNARHFASDQAGEIALLDLWSADSGEPPPGWFSALCN